MRLLLALLLALLPGAQVLHAQTLPVHVATVALGREPDRFYQPATVAGQLVANLVFDPLVGLDDEMAPYPVLAAEVPSPDNGLVRLSGDGGDRRLIVTMPLRQGVTWNDGEPFTADDVIYTWQLMMNPQSGFDVTVEDKLKSVDRIDDFTVQFTYLSSNEAHALDPERYQDLGTDPVVEPLYLFGLYDTPAIYPRHKLRDIIGDDPRHNPQVAALMTSDFARIPVGTGPYVLASWDPGNALTFTSRGLALPQRLSQPALDGIVFRVIPDKNDSLTALSAGQLQLVAQDSLDASDASVLDTLPGVQASYTRGSAWEQLTFNLDNAILADPNVRQAIAHAINRDALNNTVMSSKAEVAISQVPSWSWAFDAGLPQYRYDVDQANQLLDRAGWSRTGVGGMRAKNGQPLSLKCWSTPASFRPDLLAMIKDQLAQVGIDLRVESFPYATLFDTSDSSPQALVSHQFDIAEFAWVNSYDPGSDAAWNLLSKNFPTSANGFQGGNYGDYKNPRSDQLLKQLQNSVDPAFRHIALNEAQAIWQSDLPVLPLLLRPVVTATHGLSNYRPTPASAGETWNVEQWTLSTPCRVRLFFAVELPATVQALLGRLRSSEESRDYRWVDPALLHLTLAFLGEQPEDRLEALTRVGTAAAGASRPGRLRLGTAGSFGSKRAPRVLWVDLTGDLEALSTLHAHLNYELRTADFPVEDRPFRAHITLARRRETAHGGAPAGWPPAVTSSNVQLEALTLMHSRISPRGPTYTPLAKFQLGG